MLSPAPLIARVDPRFDVEAHASSQRYGASTPRDARRARDAACDDMREVRAMARRRREAADSGEFARCETREGVAR